eukprot:TRINITY_DN5815_c0_g1_i2.p1 TRINITY_DN5815_c0_g1~~TRINITY_DN5815_c0_g1_i2.p1  ORF type:complete len:829 (-),score=222.56 TRINITY_DN5815_c0_g1_i2:25-2169(-)
MLVKLFYDNGSRQDAEDACDRVAGYCTEEHAAQWAPQELCIFLEALLVHANVLEFEATGTCVRLSQSMPSVAGEGLDESSGEPCSAERKERAMKAIVAYRRVFDLALKNYQATKTSPPPRAVAAFETALYRIGKIHVAVGNVSQAVESLRECMRVAIAPSPHQKQRVLQLLGRVLMFACPLSEYPPPPLLSSRGTSRDPFVPTHPVEEASLAFLLQSAAAASGGFGGVHQDHTVYDDIVLAFTSSMAQCPRAIIPAFETGLSHCSQNAHVWYQFALAFMNLRRPERALVALNEHMSMAGSSPTSLLLAAKIYIRLHDTHKAIELTQKCVEACHDAGEAKGAKMMLAKAHHALGVSLFLHSRKMGSIRQQVEMGKLALENCNLAYESSSFAKKDYRLIFHMALIYGSIRDTEKAMALAKTAVELNPFHAPSFTLLVLLSTCTKDLTRALQLANAALVQHPTELWLLVTKGKIELAMGKKTQALETLKRACMSCRRALVQEEDQCLPKRSAPSFQEIRTPRSHNSSEDHLRDDEDDDDLRTLPTGTGGGGGSNAGGGGARRVEPPSPIAELWQHLAVAFGESKAYEDAFACVEEALRIQHTPDARHIKGRIFEMKGSLDEAEKEYNAALKLDTNHEANLLRKAELRHQVHNDLEGAESILASFVRRNPLNYHAWYQYGKVFEAKGDMSAASDCFITALNLEATSPILPLSTIHVEF